MSRIFPTFEEIKQGHHVFEKQGRYKGLDDDGNPQYSKRMELEVEIAHGVYKQYITIDIQLNREYEPIGFICGYDEKHYQVSFAFSEDGYKALLERIKKCLQYDKNQIEKLLQDLDSQGVQV